MRLQITLKSGAQIEADVDDWMFQNGAVKRLTWVTPENAKQRLVHVDMDQVAAIVRVK
jgi:phage-related protein